MERCSTCAGVISDEEIKFPGDRNDSTTGARSPALILAE
jgi:hypothetical protein